MIKFFRRIRRTLLDKGNLQRYILYALGEILLVMIGILLALQVNAWYQSKLDRNKELEIVLALNEELELNENYLHNSLNGLEQNVKRNGLILLGLTGPNPKDISQEEFHKMVWKTSRIPPLTPKTATFNKIINSEDLNLIKNDSLRILLIDYQAKLKWIQDDYEGLRLNGQRQEQLEKEKLVRLNMVLGSENKWFNLFDGIEPSKFNIDPKTLLRDKYFENVIVETLVSYNYFDRSANSLIENINHLQSFLASNYRIKER